MFRKYGKSERPTLCYEFGAGWDLCGAVSRYYLGVPNQIVVDIKKLASSEQINSVLDSLFKIESLHEKGFLLNYINSVEVDLLSRFRIEYLAPHDARESSLVDSSVDLIFSNNTLEHIPLREIKRILADCRRICSSGAIVSMEIDYGDHYSYTDNSINSYNFLLFSEIDWIQYNTPFHFQNRARHCDYKALFEECGFKILFEEAEISDGARDCLRNVDVHDEFSRYSFEQLLPTRGRFVLTV